jgi:hypothetical protein
MDDMIDEQDKTVAAAFIVEMLRNGDATRTAQIKK